MQRSLFTCTSTCHSVFDSHSHTTTSSSQTFTTMPDDKVQIQAASSPTEDSDVATPITEASEPKPGVDGVPVRCECYRLPCSPIGGFKLTFVKRVRCEFCKTCDLLPALHEMPLNPPGRPHRIVYAYYAISGET